MAIAAAVGGLPRQRLGGSLLPRGSGQRLALRFLDLSTAKSFSLAPAFSFSRSHLGCAPLPAQVFPDLSRYLTGTFRPLSELPPTFPLEPLSFERSSRNCTARRVRTCSTSDRSFSN